MIHDARDEMMVLMVRTLVTDPPDSRRVKRIKIGCFLLCEWYNRSIVRGLEQPIRASRQINTDATLSRKGKSPDLEWVEIS
jgi:hypothetical protein